MTYREDAQELCDAWDALKTAVVKTLAKSIVRLAIAVIQFIKNC